MAFLTAEWKKLILANYEVSPNLLQAYVPFDTELDLWEGKCYVSLVGFMFMNTKLLGIPIPFHRNFEEVNLRFYVKRKVDNEWRRGVVFIKELVPKRMLSLVANWKYKEHYEKVPMSHSWENKEDSEIISYRWFKGDRWHSIECEVEKSKEMMQAGSEEEFIAEHYYGYTWLNKSSSFEYEVKHPKWFIHPLKNYQIDADFGMVYGVNFASLNLLKPSSVFLAEGSDVILEQKTTIK